MNQLYIGKFAIRVIRLYPPHDIYAGVAREKTSGAKRIILYGVFIETSQSNGSIEFHGGERSYCCQTWQRMIATVITLIIVVFKWISNHMPSKMWHKITLLTDSQTPTVASLKFVYG